MVKTLKNNKRAFGIFLFVFSTLISVFAFIFREQFKDGQTLGLLGILIINFFSSATFFVSGPAFLTVIAGGSIYHPILVGLTAALGTALGDIVSFFFGYSTRHLALVKLEKRLLFRVFEDFFKLHGNWILFLMALIPNPFFDAAGLVAGIFKFDIKRYFIIVFVGRLVRFLLLAYIGEWHFN
jgi:membrane protein YqaA with SNARE-associated domain